MQKTGLFGSLLWSFESSATASGWRWQDRSRWPHYRWSHGCGNAFGKGIQGRCQTWLYQPIFSRTNPVQQTDLIHSRSARDHDLIIFPWSPCLKCFMTVAPTQEQTWSTYPLRDIHPNDAKASIRWVFRLTEHFKLVGKGLGQLRAAGRSFQALAWGLCSCVWLMYYCDQVWQLGCYLNLFPLNVITYKIN